MRLSIPISFLKQCNTSEKRKNNIERNYRNKKIDMQGAESHKLRAKILLQLRKSQNLEFPILPTFIKMYIIDSRNLPNPSVSSNPYHINPHILIVKSIGLFIFSKIFISRYYIDPSLFSNM